MLDKETMLINKITKNRKFEINKEIERAINPKQARIDEIQFELGNQELRLK